MAVDKLVDSTQLDTDLTSVANAIRTKGGTSAQLAFPAGFVSAVEAIPAGGAVPDLGAAGSYTLSELFYALAHDEYSTGTVTVASLFPTSSESVFCDTGFKGTVGGILIFDMANPADPIESSGYSLTQSVGYYSEASATANQSETSRGVWKAGTNSGSKQFGTAVMTSYRVNGGKLYIKPKSTALNSIYFVEGHTYRWIAWQLHER